MAASAGMVPSVAGEPGSGADDAPETACTEKPKARTRHKEMQAQRSLRMEEFPSADKDEMLSHYPLITTIL
jgi:hypothetical protein